MLNNKFIVTFNLIEYKFLNDTIDVIVLGETFLVYRVRGKVGVIFEENHDEVVCKPPCVMNFSAVNPP